MIFVLFFSLFRDLKERKKTGANFSLKMHKRHKHHKEVREKKSEMSAYGKWLFCVRCGVCIVRRLSMRICFPFVRSFIHSFSRLFSRHKYVMSWIFGRRDVAVASMCPCNFSYTPLNWFNLSLQLFIFPFRSPRASLFFGNTEISLTK